MCRYMKNTLERGCLREWFNMLCGAYSINVILKTCIINLLNVKNIYLKKKKIYATWKNVFFLLLFMKDYLSIFDFPNVFNYMLTRRNRLTNLQDFTVVESTVVSFP